MGRGEGLPSQADKQKRRADRQRRDAKVLGTPLADIWIAEGNPVLGTKPSLAPPKGAFVFRSEASLPTSRQVCFAQADKCKRRRPQGWLQGR